MDVTETDASEVKTINQELTDQFGLYHGDCCEIITRFHDDSIHFSVFSPPFSSLYTYSNSERDLGNSKNDAEFFKHFDFLISQLYRVTMPGRLISVHCMDLPSTKQHQGYIGIRDFRGEIVRHFEQEGFIYHSVVTIWKNPVTAMQRTKAIGLLHRQVVKDSTLSRQGIPDYVCTFRKPGDNPEPVNGELDHFAGDKSMFKRKGDLSIDIWQRYASPVWMDINPSKTLQYRAAREEQDERHICPLQLDVIERCIQLWSNPGDIVFTPFAGIGSEVYVAVQLGRKGVGVELKESYFKMACKNARRAVEESRESKLFD